VGRAAALARHLAIRAGDVERRLNRRRLLRKLPKNGACAEVGVWKGDGTTAILHHTRPRTVYLIDPWEHQPDHGKALYGDSTDQAAMDAVHDEVLARFGAEIEEGRVKVIRSRSQAATAGFGEGDLDWAWIDGDHSYEAVKADLDSFARIVKPDGYLAGDDYILDWWGNGVIKAIDEFVESGRGELELVGKQHFLIKLTEGPGEGGGEREADRPATS
jgi:Methyltransferase domain